MGDPVFLDLVYGTQMGAGRFIKQAERTEMRTKGLSRLDHCCCHPRAWGLKKGLRRGRRRLDKLVIAQEAQESSRPARGRHDDRPSSGYGHRDRKRSKAEAKKLFG